MPPIVQTTDGRIEGVLRNGVESFKGIPFAAPPIGALRWRAPRRVTPWKGVLLATHYRPACMQHGMYPPDAAPEPVSEDCLYLNVWKPAAAGATPLPVMVWIYGGALENGSGAVPLYAGNELARRSVIVVTANYRLGAFGFLALPALTSESKHRSSGNYGLLDQLAALRWVRRNIAAFGGDPRNITVFGQSSGSVSISALTTSPLAKGLFQKVIGESGGLFEPIELFANLRLSGAERQGLRFMARAGVRSLSALRSMPAERLLRVPFSPHITVDGYVLPRAPWESYARHEANQVSLLIGWNADEGALFLAHDRLTPDNYRGVLERSFPGLIVRLLAPSPGRSAASAYAAAMSFSTDMRFRWDMWRWATLARRDELDPVYVYEFTRSPPYSNRSPYYHLGATHGVEMQYVFDHLGPEGGEWTTVDRDLAQVIPAYWTRFARTGSPNGPGLPRWPLFEVDRPQVMQLGAQIHAGPMPDVAPLRSIGRIYGIARYAASHWVLLATVALTAIAVLTAALTRLIRRCAASLQRPPPPP